MEWLITFLIASVCVLFLWWVFDFCDEGAYIHFNRFLKYYKVNPKQWVLKKSNVRLRYEMDFKFGPIDFYRYKIWRYIIDRQETNKKLEEMFGGQDESKTNS